MLLPKIDAGTLDILFKFVQIAFPFLSVAMNKKIPSTRLKHLLKEVENVFRCKISTATNCNQLSRDIQSKTSEYISPHTLRRMFGLVKTDSSPSVYTLDVLSKYCGYQDWNQFVLGKKKSSSSSVQKEDFSKWVLDFYQSSALKKWPSNDYYFACKNVAERIVTDKTLYKTIPSQLASLPSGQILFFECFPYIDGLGNGYQQHLKIYLQNKSNNWEAQVFVNCLLFLGAYLTQNDKQLKLYYSIVNSIKCPLPREMHPIPTARYIGVQILYHHYTGNHDEMMYWCKKGIHEYIQLYKKEQARFDVNYYFILSEHLILAGLYEECAEMVEPFINRHWKEFSRVNTYEYNYYEEARLIWAISNMKLGNDIGKQMFKSINTNSFVFTKSKIYMLHFLKQQLSLCSDSAKVKREKLRKQINELVKDTGFNYFLTVNK